MQLSRISDNWLKAVAFKKTEWIPVRVIIQPYTWIRYGRKLEEVIMKHRSLFPDYVEGEWPKKLIPPDGRFVQGKFIDNWGCEWTSTTDGLAGEATRHPVDSWDKLSDFVSPDPLYTGDFKKHRDSEEIRFAFNNRKKSGILSAVSLEAFVFSRLTHLRGIDSLQNDFEDDCPELEVLVNTVKNYYKMLLQKWVDIGADVFMLADLTDSHSLAGIRPEHFRRHVKPAYVEVLSEIKEKDESIIHLHTAGNIWPLFEDLLECGIDIFCVDISNNSLENLQQIQELVCLDCRIDWATIDGLKPWEIRPFIMKALRTLAQEKGGLLLTVECAPDINLMKLEVLLKVLEEVGGPYLDSEAFS